MKNAQEQKRYTVEIRREYVFKGINTEAWYGETNAYFRSKNINEALKKELEEMGYKINRKFFRMTKVSWGI